jgi:hypothetical protein
MSKSDPLAYYIEQFWGIGVRNVHGNYIAPSREKLRDFWRRSPDLAIYRPWLDHHIAGVGRKIGKSLNLLNK